MPTVPDSDLRRDFNQWRHGSGLTAFFAKCRVMDALTIEKIGELLDAAEERDRLAVKAAQLKAANGHLQQELWARPER